MARRRQTDEKEEQQEVRNIEAELVLNVSDHIRLMLFERAHFETTSDMKTAAHRTRYEKCFGR